MSMSKIECLIDYYKTHYEHQLYAYATDAFEFNVLEALGDLSDIIDFLAVNQDELNSRLVDSVLEKYL